MKKLVKILLVLFVAGSLFSSCDMDRFPENSIIVQEALLTIEDARNWDNGIMTFFRGRQYGIFSFSQDLQVDYFNALAGFGNRGGMVHSWLFTSTDVTIRDVWFGYYRALLNINHFINSMPEFIEDGRYVVFYADGRTVNETATNANRTELDRLIGNAHLARAFYYHQLALRWSRPFNPATAATELSVPLVLEFDTNYRPARATLQQVYGQILNDIAIARTRLAGVPGTPRAARFNIDIVNALEARVRLHMQDWDEAYRLANLLITPGLYPLETTAAGMERLWITDNSNEVIMQSPISAPAELPASGNALGTANIFTNMWPFVGRQPGGEFRPDFAPTQWVIDKFAANDLRRAVYFTQGTISVEGVIVPDAYVMTKFRGNPAIPGSQTGSPGAQVAAHNAHAPKVFRVAEMYLIAAEAAVMSAAIPDAQGLARLNDLKTARGLDPLPAGTSGTVLRDAIREERGRELAFEGFRLWDLRRWGVEMNLRIPQPNVAIILAGGTGFGPTFRPEQSILTGDKAVWGLPSQDITVNPNLIQNPGW